MKTQTTNQTTNQTIKNYGEFNLIDLIKKKSKAENSSLITGIGDDCAVIKSDNKFCSLVSTDMLVEGVHFSKRFASAFDIGYKSAAVNISDVAAMGAIPSFIWLACALNPNEKIIWFEQFIDGFINCCKNYNTILAGGDISSSQNQNIFSITIMGQTKKQNIKNRCGCIEGDLIYTSGTVGDSAAGLHILKTAQKSLKDNFNTLVSAHLHPEPKVKAGQFLGSKSYVTSMIDISDGLVQDLSHLLETDNLGAQLVLPENLYSHELTRFCALNRFERNDFTLYGGEDYQLLFTVSFEKKDEFEKTFFHNLKKQPVFIGKITKSNKIYLLEQEKKTELSKSRGFDHFK